MKFYPLAEDEKHPWNLGNLKGNNSAIADDTAEKFHMHNLTMIIYQVIERTRNSIANDQWEITPKYTKRGMVLVHDTLSHCVLEVYEVSTK